MVGPDNARSVLRKIVITTLMGGISFPFTQLLFPDLPGQITMAAAFGGFVLMVQFLVDFENRLEKVERQLIKSIEDIQAVVREGFGNVNKATQLLAEVEAGGLKTSKVADLLRYAGGISPATPPLVAMLAQAEVDRVSQFLREMAEQEANYDGEDHDWLLSLTRHANRSIDAISLPEVDAAGHEYHSFWQSPLGRQYLDCQRDAIRRGIRVRRVFVTEFDRMRNDRILQHICRTQADVGIEVRLLYPESAPRVLQGYLTDFILFDNTLSYEVTPAAHVDHGESPMIVGTRLIMRPERVAERIERYRDIWDSAVPWSDPELREPVSIPYSRDPGALLEEGRP